MCRGREGLPVAHQPSEWGRDHPRGLWGVCQGAFLEGCCCCHGPPVPATPGARHREAPGRRPAAAPRGPCCSEHQEGEVRAASAKLQDPAGGLHRGGRLRGGSKSSCWPEGKLKFRLCVAAALRAGDFTGFQLTRGRKGTTFSPSELRSQQQVFCMQSKPKDHVFVPNAADSATREVRCGAPSSRPWPPKSACTLAAPVRPRDRVTPAKVHGTLPCWPSRGPPVHT